MYLFKYLKSVLIHKWHVFKHCCRLGIPVRGIFHDLSKFRPSEFFPYAFYFEGVHFDNDRYYGDIRNHLSFKYTKLGAKVRMNEAWNLHQKRNKHHWQYWLLKCDSGDVVPIEMPYKHIQEMVADWVGAGMVYNPTAGKNKDIYEETREWYRKNKHTMILGKYTRLKVEEIIGLRKV